MYLFNAEHLREKKWTIIITTTLHLYINWNWALQPVGMFDQIYRDYRKVLLNLEKFLHKNLRTHIKDEHFAYFTY